MDDLARRLVIARADGIAHQDLLTRLSDTDLLILDDYLTVRIDPDAASDLFAILANREHRLPTLIASQSGPDYWAQALPDRVAADSIVNRLANNARAINLGQVDMRRQRGQQARAAEGYCEWPPRRSGSGSDQLLPNPRNRATNKPDWRYQLGLSANIRSPLCYLSTKRCGNLSKKS